MNSEWLDPSIAIYSVGIMRLSTTTSCEIAADELQPSNYTIDFFIKKYIIIDEAKIHLEFDNHCKQKVNCYCSGQ